MTLPPSQATRQPTNQFGHEIIVELHYDGSIFFSLFFLPAPK
jgi:hypothetical protein